jgi:hypothetical protein
MQDLEKDMEVKKVGDNIQIEKFQILIDSHII